MSTTRSSAWNIDDALALARKGQPAEEHRPVSLGRAAREAWRTVDTAEATLETPTDAVIRADPKRLRRIIENLFCNAVEHGSEDVTVEVGTIDESEPAGNGSPGAQGFYVADDGPGIPPAEREEVFERGYSTGGTGLGLAIVRRIAEAHGWTVEVTESDTGWARFEFTGVRFRS